MSKTDNSQTAKINSILAEVIRSTIQEVNLNEVKTNELRSALQHLQDITHIYDQSEQQLYECTVDKVQAVTLLDFQAEALLLKLIQKYFKKLPLFKESYEIAELKAKKPKYERLQVDDPVIELTIQSPYCFAPLCEARQLGEAVCVKFQEEEETVERFS